MMEHREDSGDNSDGKAAELCATQAAFRRYIADINANSMVNTPFDLTRIYPETTDVAALMAQVDDLKRCLDSFRPLNPAQVKNLEQAFDVEYTYDSNRIEGNTLTLHETYLVVEKGMTISGKPLTDHLEAVNHRDALAFMKDIATKKVPLTERVVLDIHNFILSNIDWEHAGRYRSMAARIGGARHIPPNPMKIPQLMHDLFVHYEVAKQTEHPVILAADLHSRLVNIHPFVDGNGRTARLVMNLILLQNGFAIANISGDREVRTTYYEALDTSAVDGNAEPFSRFVLSAEKQSLIKYLDMMSPDIEHGKGGYFLERIRPFLPPSVSD